MKKYIFLNAILLSIFFNVYGQKQNIDNHSFDKWNTIKDLNDKICVISNDGKYAAYRYGNVSEGDFIEVKSLDNRYLTSINLRQNDYQFKFSADSKFAFVLCQDDTLTIVDLEKKTKSFKSHVHSFDGPEKNNSQWIVYLKNETGELTIRNLKNAQERKYLDVKGYKLNEIGTSLVIEKDSGLIWLDLVLMKEVLLCESSKVSQITFDHSGKQLAFIEDNLGGRQIFYFRNDLKKARVIVDGYAISHSHDKIIGDGDLRFTSDGKRILFDVNLVNDTASKDDIEKSVDPTIWSYNDRFIGIRDYKSESLKAIVEIESSRTLILTSPNTQLRACYKNFALVYNKVNYLDFSWNNDAFNIYLISLFDSNTQKIASIPKNVNLPDIHISPNEKFIVWFDYGDHQFHSYDISKKTSVIVSNKIKVPLYDIDAEQPGRRRTFGVAGWLKDDELLIYDKFGIWQINLSNSHIPINLTQAEGRSNEIIFRIAENHENDFIPNCTILAGFESQSKKNGLFKFWPNKKFEFIPEAMGDYVYCKNSSNSALSSYYSDATPISDYNHKKYIVLRQNAEKSPNLFVTENFLDYKEFTHIYPEQNCNYLTTKLINWSLPDGRKTQGIIYKPANFDCKKKYPVIFHYYEKNSDELNVFKTPKLSDGSLNIPWYVSNGYLVFVPDMISQTGNNAESMTRTIVSAIKILKDSIWIDLSHIGLQGHSYGGYSTINLISKLNLFKAAQESAGPLDLGSFHSMINYEMTRQSFTEFDQFNMGVSPWENPTVYMRNSPLYYLDNVATPLLIMHGMKDNIAPLYHSTQLFASLKRLNKPVWLLLYNKGDHTLRDQAEIMDFNIRQEQFFGYYLKGEDKPSWMN
jgi:dipeptidyl aminopeptidase/acylaminoacyl peptidase